MGPLEWQALHFPTEYHPKELEPSGLLGLFSLARTTSLSASGSLLTPTAYFEIAYFNHLYVLTEAE